MEVYEALELQCGGHLQQSHLYVPHVAFRCFLRVKIRKIPISLPGLAGKPLSGVIVVIVIFEFE